MNRRHRIDAREHVLRLGRSVRRADEPRSHVADDLLGNSLPKRRSCANAKRHFPRRCPSEQRIELGRRKTTRTKRRVVELPRRANAGGDAIELGFGHVR